MRANEFITEESWVNFKPGWEVETPDGTGVIQSIEGKTVQVELWDNPGLRSYNFSDLKIVDTHGIREKTSSKNAKALTGSGRADPSGKKPGRDSPQHRKVRTPGTTYSKSRRKYNASAKPGAIDGFIG